MISRTLLLVLTAATLALIALGDPSCSMVSGPRVDDLDAAVGGSAIDDHHVEIGDLLDLQRAQGERQVLRVVEVRHDHRRHGRAGADVARVAQLLTFHVDPSSHGPVVTRVAQPCGVDNRPASLRL